MTKQEKIALVKRLCDKGYHIEAEVACIELHVPKKYLTGGKNDRGILHHK